MGGVADAFSDAFDFVGEVVEDFGDFVSDAFDAVGDVVKDIGDAIGDAVDAVGDFLGDVADFAQVFVERYAIQAALMAVGIPPQFAAPMSAGMHTLAKGGDIEDALKSAATVAVIQQVGQEIQVGMEAANADAIAQGGEAIYSATEIAAATSAAQSAIATAAAGGDLEDAVLGAAIGGVSGASATEVYNQTGSLAAANFTRVTMQASLQGVEVEQAILMGASATMVTYLQQMNKTINKSTEISDRRAASVRAYQDRVESYNEKLARYKVANDSSIEETYDPVLASRLATELRADLEVINNLSAQIGSYNSQLAKLSSQYDKQQKKAEEEAKRTDFDFKSRTQAQLDAEQQQRDELADELGRMIAETEGRRYEGIDIAAGQLPAGIDESIRTLPLVGEDVVNESESSDAIRRTVTGTDANGQEYSYNIVIDKSDGSVFYEVLGGDETGTTTIAYDERPVFGEGTSPGQTATVEEIVARQPTLTELEIQQLNEAARGTRATQLRSATEDYLFEQELEDLEAELESAASDAEKAASRAQFVQQQRQRLSQAQRLPGGLQSQIDAELNQILDEYERSKGEAAEKAATKERIVATQQERRGTVSDEEVMRLLGISPGEGERYGLGTGGGGAGFKGIPEGTIQEKEEAPLEGEMELGGGEGEGEPESAEQRFDAQGRPIISTAVFRQRQELGGRGQTPGIPSRVTGEALVGILGEKEPLFGGDEDQQQAVWNRRSLRLRKALGL